MVQRANQIGAEGVRKLAGVMGGCKAGAPLNLGSNYIGAERLGAEILVAVVRECKTLTHLSVFRNKLGVEGAGRIDVALPGECTPEALPVVHLHFSLNKLGAAEAGRRAGVLKDCKALLARLDLCHIDIGFDGAGRQAAVRGPGGVSARRWLTVTLIRAPRGELESDWARG